MRKRGRLILVGILSVVLLSGCNLKEKISENITEGIIEKATDGEVDVEINGDDVSYATEEGEMTIDEDAGVTYEGEDGTVIASGGDYEWPADQAAAYLPKLDNGTITYHLNGPDACLLTVEELTLDDYKSYKDAIIGAGFTDDNMDSSAEDLEIYSGTSADGIVATISYTESEGSLQISLDASGAK